MPDTRKILQNVYILPCDESGGGGIGTVTIRNDRITSVSYGRSRSDVPAPDVEVVDGTGKVLLPGFVDLHVHGESLLFDLLTAGEPQSRWQKIQKFTDAEDFWYQRATFDDWRRLYTSVCFQALRSGVTFLGEFGVPGGDDACAASLEAFGRTELSGMLTLHNADQLDRIQRGQNRAMRFCIALPPAEELTTYNLQASLRLSRESGFPMMVHLGDIDKDMDVMLRNFGRGPLQVLEEYGILEAGCIVVHMHSQESKDVQRLLQRRVVPILSPGGALRKGLPMPPVSAYRSQGIRTAVCTDWGPFAHWSVLKGTMERDLTVRSQAPSAIGYLRDLTSHAASVIGLAEEFGSIVPGKRANLQMIRCRSLELQAALDVLGPDEVAQAMVQRITSSDVSDVMVNGEFCIREGTVLTYSEEDIVRDIHDLLDAPKTPHLVVTRSDELQRDAGDGGTGPDLSDEGFRIIRRTEESPPVAAILPLDPTRDQKKELPKMVRRVFGEDDL